MRYFGQLQLEVLPARLTFCVITNLRTDSGTLGNSVQLCLIEVEFISEPLSLVDISPIIIQI